MFRLFVILLVLLVRNVAHAADKSQPRSVDPELKIELFAEHPTIVTPTGIDVDHKGRVFAVESNTHFRPKGYKGHPSDRVLVLQDTNGDGKADKTTVFTDDLKYTMSVAVKPLWLEVGGRKSEVGGRKKNPQSAIRNPQSIYVATRSAIYLYHDTNGDLKADKRERIVHLETKGNYPHNGLAGIAFDAMGWMYFGFGENLGAKYTLIGSDGVKLSGGGEGGNVYRCRPDGSKLSRWATGFWNPHASCVDAFGRLFTVDNDPDSRPPCRLLHVIEGGDYGFRFRNGRAGLHPFTAWNGEIPGTLPMVSGTGEAPSGIVAYESDGLPRKYIGSLLVGSWGDHRIDRFVLQPKGASFVSRPEPVIQGGEDFRPVGLAVAPDGSVFCTDWVKRDYKLHGHGRVWRISRKPKGERRGVSPPRKPRVIDISTITPKRPVKELTALLSHPRLEVRRMAARAISALDEQQIDSVMKSLRDPKATSVRTKAEFLWLMPHSKAVLRLVFKHKLMSVHKTQLQNDMQEVRGKSWSEVLNVDFKGKPPRGPATELWKEVVENQRNAMMVKGALSSTAYIPVFKSTDWDAQLREDREVAKQGLGILVEKGDDFCFAALLDVLRESNSPRFLKDVLATKGLRPRLYLLALLGLRSKTPTDKDAVTFGLKYPSPDVRRVAVQWVAEENLKELKPQVQAVLNGKVMNADMFLATLAALEMLDGKRPQDFDKTPAGKYVLPLVKDANRPAAVRAVALRLVDPDEPSLSESLFKQMLAAKDAKLKTEAVRTLHASQRPFAGKLLAAVALDGASPAALRADAMAGLAGRSLDAKTTRALLGLTASKNRIMRHEAVRSFRTLLMKTAAGRPIRTRLIGQITDAIEKDGNVLGKNGTVRYVAEQLALAYREAGIELPGALLTAHRYRPKAEGWYDWAESKRPYFGDAAAGQRVFFASNNASCSRCHTVNGRGGNIGPDLTTIARTANRRKLAESILEPAKEIAPQFTLWSFAMDDGKVHHGVILGDTRDGKRQRIGTPEGKFVDLPLNRIELRTPQSKSAMPEKLIDRLTASEFRDLLAYMETLK